MGGYLGKEDQWKAFEVAWKALLNGEGVTVCHADWLMHSAKEFKGWSRDRRTGFLVKAQKAISESLQFGFTAIIRRNDYNELYKVSRRLSSCVKTLCMASCFVDAS